MAGLEAVQLLHILSDTPVLDGIKATNPNLSFNVLKINDMEKTLRYVALVHGPVRTTTERESARSGKLALILETEPAPTS